MVEEIACKKDGVRLLTDGVRLLTDGVRLLTDGVRLLILWLKTPPGRRPGIWLGWPDSNRQLPH